MPRKPSIAFSLVFLIPAMLIALGCATERAKHADTLEAHAPSEIDPHSFAHPEEARVTDVKLDLEADFESKSVHGSVRLEIARAPGAARIILDSRDLIIEKVTGADGSPRAYEIGPQAPIVGGPLSVQLAPKDKAIILQYRTKPGAAALQWLSPSQTTDRKLPFLFTQGQAILTRTWIPLQDSPGIRQTYSARITVPSSMTAVMSAALKDRRVTPDGQKALFEFEMKEPIPAYLIALAAGDLAFRSLGPRTGVYAEPSVVEGAASEFRDVERMIDAVEAIYGPYRWGRYDILVLPPSFPFGGMENPRLTFASPTVIAGDRSLVSLLAHELSHSWSGNLVTNATWSDFWLNEGFTVYLETRIDEALFGRARSEMIEVLGREDLVGEIGELGRDSPKTKLWRELKGEDPDDCITSVPYEKGSAFLRLLEHAVGRAALDQFLKKYFDEHAFQSMTTARFLDLVKADLLGGDQARAEALRIDEWVYGTGLPENAPAPSSPALERVQADALRFSETGQITGALADQTYGALEWIHFLRKLPRALSEDRLLLLERAFGFSKTRNAEIRFEWLRIVIASHLETALPSLEEFLVTQGRRRLVLPLYEDMLKTTWGKEKARAIYERARPLYHAITRESIEEAFASDAKKHAARS